MKLKSFSTLGALIIKHLSTKKVAFTTDQPHRKNGYFVPTTTLVFIIGVTLDEHINNNKKLNLFNWTTVELTAP